LGYAAQVLVTQPTPISTHNAHQNDDSQTARMQLDRPPEPLARPQGQGRQPNFIPDNFQQGRNLFAIVVVSLS
jgi:hypothetical protein